MAHSLLRQFSSSPRKLYLVFLIFLAIACSGPSATAFTTSRQYNNNRGSYDSGRAFLPRRTSLTRIAGQASTGKSGGKLIVTHEEYDCVLEESKENGKALTLVFFTASWCGPCRQTLPAVRAVRAEHAENLNIYEVDVDESGDIVASTGIESVPTIFVMLEGKLLDFTVGSVTEGVLKNVVKAGFKKMKK